MPRKKHLTVDVINLGVLWIVCSTRQAAETVPVIPHYRPPARCPNHSCAATWFVQKTLATRVLQHFVTRLAALQEQRPEVSASVQFVIPVSV
jgi:hypothetical protein